jgi:hypothetical protein
MKQQKRVSHDVIQNFQAPTHASKQATTYRALCSYLRLAQQPRSFCLRLLRRAPCTSGSPALELGPGSQLLCGTPITRSASCLRGTLQCRCLGLSPCGLLLQGRRLSTKSMIGSERSSRGLQHTSAPCNLAQ